MEVLLEYGKTGLAATLPDARMIAPPLTIREAPPLTDPIAALNDSLRQPIGTPPLRELAQGKGSACIVICDITRPVPNSTILPPILQTLEEAGIPRAKITILIATGLHRPNEGAELDELVGVEIARNYNCVNHHGKVQEEHEYLGESQNGVPIWIDRRYMEAELKITTGLIEPHLMAGYSGGRKLVCPGIMGLETVSVWHGPRFLEHPKADAGSVVGNPVHEENTAIALQVGCDFIVNVCIDGQRRITWLGAGDMIQAWEQGVDFCRETVKAAIDAPCDVVVTSCAGYPLDATWYQAVKGLTGALPIVKKGGTIIIAASLSEGLGSPEFQRWLDDYRTMGRYKNVDWQPETATVSPSIHADICEMDEWQLVMLQKVLAHCHVVVISDGLPAETLRQCHVEVADSIEEAVEDALEKYGADATLAVIPKGPYVLPVVG